MQSLLRFLIQIVMQNYGGDESAMNKSSEARKEATKKNLMELLKSEASHKTNIYGSEGGMAVL